MSKTRPESKLVSVMGLLCEDAARDMLISAPRLVKLTYLCDWRAALQFGQQITPVVWQRHLYGPYSAEVVQSAERHENLFRVFPDKNASGEPITMINLRSPFEASVLNSRELGVAQEIIQEYKHVPWSHLVETVLRTYPSLAQPTLAELNLPELAKEVHEGQEVDPIADLVPKVYA